MTSAWLCEIAKGPKEDIRPVNVGLLFFCKKPEKFFQRPWIEIVWFYNGSDENFREFYFKGPVQIQLRDALAFIRSSVIAEQVSKVVNQAEADRFYNFPYRAIEEVLANAVYHRSYEIDSPVEVQIWPQKIEVLSHPGPIPPVTANDFEPGKRVTARDYRNRRVGDFLKELKLTEGRGTGMPSIYRSMEKNGSPLPVFTTDEITYFLATLPVHPRFDAIVYP